MRNKKKYTYKAWTRKAGTNDQYCTQEVVASSQEEAKKLIAESGREIDGFCLPYKN